MDTMVKFPKYGLQLVIPGDISGVIYLKKNGIELVDWCQIIFDLMMAGF